MPARATGAASSASTQLGASTAPARTASASLPMTRAASPWCHCLGQTPPAKQVTCPQLSPSCWACSESWGNTQHGGSARRWERGQQPEPLSFILSDPAVLLPSKQLPLSTNPSVRVTWLWLEVSGVCLFSPSSSSFPQGSSGASRSGAGDGPLLLLVRAVTLQTRTVSNNALWPARASRSKHLGQQGTCPTCLYPCPGPSAGTIPHAQHGTGQSWVFFGSKRPGSTRSLVL